VTLQNSIQNMKRRVGCSQAGCSIQLPGDQEEEEEEEEEEEVGNNN
jgi:hypothetical protein